MRKTVHMLLIAALICAGCGTGKPAVAPAPSTAPPAHPPAPTEDGSWAALPAVKTEAVQWAGYELPLDAAPDGQYVAYCTTDSIRTSADGGNTWRTIPTGPVATLAAAGDFPVTNAAGPNQVTCSSVLVDPVHPDSIYATFSAGRKATGAPPVYQVGYYTGDAGRTWHHAPAATGYTDGDFGGFQRRSDGIVALFHRPGQSAGTTAQLTTDGGATWNAASLGCLTDSACIAFDAPQTERGSCAMHDYEQPLLLSADRGKSWTSASLPDRTNACHPSQLIASAPGQAMLVRQWSDSPLLRTTDGGKTWTTIALPPVPHSTTKGPLHAGLQMLPNGTLIGRDGETLDGEWLWLKPGARQWCALPAGLIAKTAIAVRAAGNRIWWVESDNNGAVKGFGQADLTKLQCAP
jgi:hypothetical protein